MSLYEMSQRHYIMCLTNNCTDLEGTPTRSLEIPKFYVDPHHLIQLDAYSPYTNLNSSHDRVLSVCPRYSLRCQYSSGGIK